MYRQILAKHGVQVNAQNSGNKADREFDQFANCDQLEDMDVEIDKDEE